MSDTLLIALDVAFPYLRFPSLIMICVFSALSIYLLLNIKTTFHRGHYAYMGMVLFLCLFQCIPITQKREDHQLHKVNKILEDVSKSDKFTKDVFKDAEKLKSYRDAMLKKGYINYGNQHILSIIRKRLENNVRLNLTHNPLVNVTEKIPTRSEPEIIEQLKSKPQPVQDVVHLIQVPVPHDHPDLIANTDQNAVSEISASEANTSDTISKEKVIIEKPVDQKDIQNTFDDLSNLSNINVTKPSELQP